MRIRREVLFTLAAVIFSISNLYANSENSTRIAIIADKTSGLNNLALFSLLEVELSQKEGIKLLERAAIDTLLEEQKLSAAGLLDRNTTIKIGKLLRADAFIILSLENSVSENGRVDQGQESGDLFRVRVAETAHGLRLADFFEQSDTTNPQQAAERIIQKIDNTLEKINKPNEKLIPVGIVDIHRVQLGEKYKMLERTLPAMLSVRLSHEPQIIVLEREDLKVLLDEKLMTQGEDSEFWSSAILIDGYIQPQNGQLELHLNLKQAAGENLKSIIIPVEPNEPVISIEHASTEIINELQNSPPTTKWNPEQEAEQFYKKAQMLEAHGLYDVALDLFETAHILHFKNALYTGTLFERLWIIRLNIEMKNVGRTYISSDQGSKAYKQFNISYSDLELAELLSIFVRQISDGYEKGEYSAQYIFDKWLKYFSVLSFTPHTKNYFFSKASISSEQVKLLNRQTRKIWMETCNKALKKEVLFPDGRFINNLCRANMVWISSDDPYELVENIKKSFTEFVMPPGLGGQIKTERERNLLCERSFRKEMKSLKKFIDQRDLGDSFDFDLFLKLRRDFMLEMTEVNDTVVRFNSFLDLCYLPQEFNATEQDIIQAKDYIFKAIKILSGNIVNSKIPFAQFPSSEISEIEDSLAMLNIPPDEYLQIWIDFYRPIIEKKDPKILAICNPGLEAKSIAYYLKSNKNEIKWYQLLEEMAEILSTDNNDKQIMQSLNILRDSQVQIRKRLQIFTGTQKSNENVNILLNKKDWLIPIHFSDGIMPNRIKTKQMEDILWISFLFDSTTTGSTVCLAGINLKTKKINTLYQPDFPMTPRPTQITGLEVGFDIIYVSTKGGGIVKFPLAKPGNKEYLTNLQKYTMNNGLPSMNISSIAIEKDKIWVAYGESFYESGLGIYEPKTEKWKSILCSTIKGGTPFNSGTPYKIQDITFIAPNKYFFILNDPELGISDIDKWLGLWKINTNNYKCEPVLIGDNLKNKTDISLKEFQNKWWVWDHHISPIVEFDLVTEKSQVIEWHPYEFATGNNNKLHSAAIYNDILWGQWGKSQVIKIKVGKKLEDAELIDNNLLDGQPVWQFVSTPYGLVGIGNGIVGLIEVGD